MEPEQEGMSTPKKVVAGAAVGVAIPAAVGVAKKILSDDSDQEGETNDRGESRDKSAGDGSRSTRSQQGRSSSRRQSGSTARSKTSKSARSSRSRSSGSSAKSRSGSSSGSGRTKEQLYATAKRLKIDGRSKMSKPQLERAVANARR